MSEKRFTYDKPLVAFSKGGINDNVTGETYEFTIDTVLDLLNELHEENMNNRAEITRFKLIVSDIVDDLEKQAKSEEPILISMEYVDWIKSELDLKLNGLKR